MYYKLTDKNNQTKDNTQWGEGIVHKAQGKGSFLCSKDVIHVYDSPLKAIMFNPIHANFPEYNLWECEVEGVVANDGLKVGVKTCTTLRQINPPEITLEQRVTFAILCALKVYKDEAFQIWAEDWLSGRNRAARAAWAARAAAGAEGAAEAARAAAWAAAEAAGAARAAEGAARAAEGAAGAAEAARAATKEIDFDALIKEAMERAERKS